MTELGDIFEELGLGQYLDVFVEHGFDTWDTILDITESDFDALGVKLGHRRKLQRRIANSRGLSSDQALKSPTRNVSSGERHGDDNKSDFPTSESRDGNTGSGKRKYRRHPKPDENAPERPPSAYVIFSNKMRVDLKGRHLSFTEIAKLVGESWQNLSPKEKEPYEAQAFLAKEKYNAQLAQYKTTEEYSRYSIYLQEFKEKQANLQNANDASKRPKLEHQISTSSSGAGSSGGSQHGADSAASLMKHDAAASATTRFSTSGGQSPLNKGSNWTGPNVGQSGGASVMEQDSPSAKQFKVLPGYRESIYGTFYQQPLAWRDNIRQDASAAAYFPSVTAMEERRTGYFATSPVEPLSQFNLRSESERRTGRSFSPPPLLNSESTTGTTISSASNSSSLQYMPRTPLEPPLDRPLAIAPLYPSKPYENQLPPIRAMSIPPQTSINAPYNSPSGILAMDHPSASSRPGYMPPRQPEIRSPSIEDPVSRVSSCNVDEDEPLDPVSALLKADEIVNRASRNRPAP